MKIIVAVLLLSSASAWAVPFNTVSQSKFTVGGLIGPGFYNNNAGTNASFSAQAEVKGAPEIGVGLYLGYASLGSSSVPGVGSYSSSITFLMPQANYYFMGDLEGLHLGLKLGLGWTSTSSTISSVASGSSTDIAFGPAIGYDYALAQNFTIGGEASYFNVTTSPSTQDVNLLAAVKYWF